MSCTHAPYPALAHPLVSSRPARQLAESFVVAADVRYRNAKGKRAPRLFMCVLLPSDVRVTAHMSGAPPTHTHTKEQRGVSSHSLSPSCRSGQGMKMGYKLGCVWLCESGRVER